MLGITKFRPFARTEDFDEASFNHWLEKGSLAAAGYELRKLGFVRGNGKPYTNAGVRYAAIRHYIRTYPESRQKIESEYKKRGFIGAPEHMDIATIDYACEIIWTIPRLEAWLKEYNLYDGHVEYIQEKINVILKRRNAHRGKKSLES